MNSYPIGWPVIRVSGLRMDSTVPRNGWVVLSRPNSAGRVAIGHGERGCIRHVDYKSLATDAPVLDVLKKSTRTVDNQPTI